VASSKIARRRFVAGTAVASAAFVAAPFVRGAYAAGKLTLAFWDHWVPNANDATKALIDEWAAKEKVEVQVDFITSQGNKLLLTGAAESQAKSGHDIFALAHWLPSRYANQLVAMNDIMEPLIKLNGAVNGTVEYLGKVDGKWLGVPATVGSQIKGPCSRIDLMKDLAGIDVQAMYPAGAPAKADAWTFDAFLKAAEACHKGGVPFGIWSNGTNTTIAHLTIRDTWDNEIIFNPGAQSPRESYLRLLLIDAGLPRPQTQIPVPGVDGIPLAYLDLGWPEYMVAVEYDCDQHRTDRRQFVKDIRRLEMLERMGWNLLDLLGFNHSRDFRRTSFERRS